MKSEDPFGLRPLWDASLEIYQEVAVGDSRSCRPCRHIEELQNLT